MAEALDIDKRSRQQKIDDEKKMELHEHLGELRARIIRAAIYVIVASILAYNFFRPIYDFLYAPMVQAMKDSKVEYKIVFQQFTQPFFVVLQLSLAAGIVMVGPLVTMELFGFISPALTKEERRPLYYVAPFATCLFLSGITLAYWVSKFAVKWFVGYVEFFPNAVLYQDPKSYVLFMIKLMAIFGGVFQLPVILMFLAWVGLLRSEGMKKSWRTAVVLISIIGLFVTPSNDPFSMLIMIIPVIFLYLGSIFLVQIIEKKRDERLAKQFED